MYSHEDRSLVNFGAVYELADSIVLSSFFDVPNKFRKAFQKQAGRVRNSYKQAPQEACKQLRGHQAGPLHSLLHQSPDKQQQYCSFDKIQTAIKT